MSRVVTSLWLLASSCTLIPAESATVDIPPSAGALRVDIQIGPGTVKIRESATDEVSGRFDVEFSGNQPETTWSTDQNGTFTIVGSCRNGGVRCNTDLTLAVPAGFEVFVLNKTGDVTVDGAFSRLEIDNNNGRIDVSGIRGNARITTGNGKVIAAEMTSPELAIDVKTGGIEVQMVGKPTDLDTQTGAGDIQIEVPDGRYVVDASTGVGRVDVFGVTEDEDADGMIRARTEVGDIEIVGDSAE